MLNTEMESFYLFNLPNKNYKIKDFIWLIMYMMRLWLAPVSAAAGQRKNLQKKD